MGSQCKTNTDKPHYNISMSKRTRKPHNPRIESFEDNKDCTKNIQDEKVILKRLTKGRCSLAQCFKEEEGNQQEVIIRPSCDDDDDDRFHEMKSKNFAKNYAKFFLSHLIKVNQESYFRSWRKAAPSFKFIKHTRSK
ncbi:hypothetical protein CASFOL_041067 [Castilleja foliolosa]|uniref:Uncharacterized protein n=1 Tax=Castilleja foliolosa TaxID=1961234 RepID=A0ABD3BED1_9LAMI